MKLIEKIKLAKMEILITFFLILILVLVTIGILTWSIHFIFYALIALLSMICGMVIIALWD